MMQTTILLLLVEDDDGIRLMLEEVLTDSGFETATARNGAEALTILDARGKSLRGVIADINLGAGPDGWEVARHARQVSGDLPIVYMSGGAAHFWTSHGVPNSILVTKPFAPAQIVTAISTLINTGDIRH